MQLLTLSDKVKSASPSANVTSPCFDGISDGPANGTAIDVIFAAQSTSGTVGTGTQYVSVSTGSTKLTPLQVNCVCMLCIWNSGSDTSYNSNHRGSFL
jgi:hypothetical protein